MKNIRPRFARVQFISMLALLAVVACVYATTAHLQQRVPKPKLELPAAPEASMERSSVRLPREEAAPQIEEATNDVPTLNAVTTTSYPFSAANGVALEDMSTGTTQLVPANSDDGASLVTNIGFDFWYDGVRFTQFSCNANGVCRMGSTVISTEFDNGSATFGFNTTTNAPKIAPYFDDLWTGTNGKVHFKLTGSAPNRKLIVEWLNEQIPRVATGLTGAGTFQMWMFETTGVIEFVYGSGIATNTTNGGYSIGLQSGAATNFASVTSSTDTVSYAAANNTQTNAITSGKAYIFTPQTATAPSGLNFTGTTALATTLNWTDNSSNEVGFAIYRSTDGGTNYSFLTQTAANATSFTDNTVLPNTNYFYRVYAVTEGAVSGPAQNSVTTNAAGNISSTAAGGNWSAPATWVGGVVPTASDNVTIVDGATVTIDTAAVAFSVAVGTGGGLPAILQYEAITARSLTVGSDVTIATNGTFQSAPSGTVTTHTLSLVGNLTNNNVLDFSTNANTAGAGITFTGAANNTFGGTGALTDLRTLTINKGTSNANILEVTTSNFTVQGVNTDGTAAAFLTLTNGTLKVSGTFTATLRTFTAAAYTIGATTGFWLNNPNFNVAGQNGSPTESGLLRITQGTFNIGTSTGNSMGFATGSNIIVEGGAVNATGRFGVAAAANVITYTQTAGTITVCTVGNASTTLGSFDLGTSVSSSITMSGGTIVVQLAATGASGPRDYRNGAGGGITGITGGTLQLGNAASGAAKIFNITNVVPNLVISNASAGHTVVFQPAAVGSNYNDIALNVTINPGTTLTPTGTFLMNGTTFTNNGTLNATGGSANFVWFLTTAPQTYTGTGTVTAPMTNMSIQADSGLSFDPSVSNVVCGAVRMFSGSVTNSNKITLGNGGATTGVVQIGNASPGTGTNAGSFDVPFTFNLGTGGQTISYLRTTLSRTTGNEVNPTRILTSMLYDDNDPTHTLTIAGGDLALTTALTMTNGRIVTNANALALSSGTATVTRTNGYVDGNFKKTYSAAANKTFEVGTANGYSPVAVDVTAGTFPGDFTVKAVQGQMPQITGTNALQRYWALSNNITANVANLTFNYLATDVVGNPANYFFYKNNGGALTQVSPTGTPTTTQAVANGVSSFSDWTLAETSAVQSGTFQFSSAAYTDSETNADHTFNAVVNRVGGSDGNVSVDYQVTDGTATVAAGDYTIASPTGTLTWNDGDATPRNVTITVKGDLSFEPDETVNFQLSNPQGAGATLGTPNSAVLTITNDDAPVSAGQLIISEFRVRGPNPNGAQNEFIEIYNNTNSPHTVGATDASAGYGVAASDGVLRCTIPNGTVIPTRGHFLCVNSVGYSLGNYPSGNFGPGTFAAPDAPETTAPKRGPKMDTSQSAPADVQTDGARPEGDEDVPPSVPNATGDATYTTDIPDNAGIALFSSTTTFTLANRLDAVGSTSEANTLYKEGTGYSALTPFSIEYSFMRDTCGKSGSPTVLGACPQGGLPKDTDNNAADFYFADTNGTCAIGVSPCTGPAGQRLGAPGPENLSSPVQRNNNFPGPNIDSTLSSSSPPNRIRDFTSDPANNSTFGTLDIRKRIVNNTGGPVTRLRFRVMDFSTFPVPSGFADLRVRTSTLVVVSGINDAGTCLASNGVATTPCTINVQGTTLEQPPSQLNGGGFNSTLSAGTVTLGTPLANGASINVRFLLGIQQTGTFKFFINVEALP